MKMEPVKLKALLGIAEGDSSQDAVLQFLLDDVQETILNYCKLSKLPEGLTHTAYRMAIDLYRYDRPGDGDGPMAVSAITQGDTSTSFTRAAEALDGGLLQDYRAMLNGYRKLRW